MGTCMYSDLAGYMLQWTHVSTLHLIWLPAGCRCGPLASRYLRSSRPVSAKICREETLIIYNLLTVGPIYICTCIVQFRLIYLPSNARKPASFLLPTCMWVGISQFKRLARGRGVVPIWLREIKGTIDYLTEAGGAAAVKAFSKNLTGIYIHLALVRLNCIHTVSFF